MSIGRPELIFCPVDIQVCLALNTVAGFLAGASGPLLVLFGPDGLAAAIVATMVTHTFLDAVPSTFLGVPDPDTVLSVLPAHRLCLAGHGEEAVRVSALGSVAGFVLCLPLFVMFMYLLPPLQGYIDWGIGLVILLAAGLLIVFSRSPGWAFDRVLTISRMGTCGVWSLRYSWCVFARVRTFFIWHFWYWRGTAASADGIIWSSCSVVVDAFDRRDPSAKVYRPVDWTS